MKVNFKSGTKSPSPQFAQLAPGDAFTVGGGVFLKTEERGGFNAVRLWHGTFHRFGLTDGVTPRPDAEVNVP